MSSHTLTQCQDSVLALVANEHFIFAGTQTGSIYMWDTHSFSLVTCLPGHSGHVLSLALSENGKWLFSAGDEGNVRVWDIENDLCCCCIIHAGDDSGDINALVYANSTQTIYLGCKNASIQFFDMKLRQSISRSKTLIEWKSRDSRFFRQNSLDLLKDANSDVYVIFEDMILPMCHNGFIYCLLLVSIGGKKENLLFSGSGDGSVKIWNIENITPAPIRQLKVAHGSVLALTLLDELLYTGSQDGEIKAWDIDTWQCIRTLKGHSGDILSMSTGLNNIFSGSADGTIRVWNRNFECVEILEEHVGIVLSLAISKSYLISGGNDQLIKIWTIFGNANIGQPLFKDLSENSPEDKMISYLREFVSFDSVSGNPDYSSQSLRCAKFLKSLLVEMGAESYIVPGVEYRNPIVLAKFVSYTNSDIGNVKRRKNILVYGHYDVQPASKEQWKYPPFQMTGADGYIYGRGVTDNKGPVLAMIFAVCDLFEKRQLNANVYFAIEGEEETGSAGFFDAIKSHKSFFGDIDLILFSNSYWLDDKTPCITYGLRGVIHTKLEITSPINEDLHSGVHGGVYDEPLNDMIQLLSYLKCDHDILIPDFNDGVHKVTMDEQMHYEEILSHVSKEASKPVESVLARWIYPTLTIHKIEVSGPASNTVIPRSVYSLVSMRIVPYQKLELICKSYEEYVAKKFASMKTKNRLMITIGHTADWWLEDWKQCPYIDLAASVIEETWNMKPLLIREGGSIPAIPFLKQFFNASVLQIPMGQASDNAHLPNERIRLTNLKNGRSVIRDLIKRLQD